MNMVIDGKLSETRGEVLACLTKGVDGKWLHLSQLMEEMAILHT
jgi:hypothetical protein